MHKITVNLLTAQCLGRRAEVAREIAQVEHLSRNRLGRAIAQLQILNESLTKGCHSEPHGGRKTPGISCDNYGSQTARAQIATTATIATTGAVQN